MPKQVLHIRNSTKRYLVKVEFEVEFPSQVISQNLHHQYLQQGPVLSSQPVEKQNTVNIMHLTTH